MSFPFPRIANSNPITNLSPATITVQSLTSDQPLAFTAVDLQVADPSQLNARLSMTGGSMS